MFAKAPVPVQALTWTGRRRLHLVTPGSWTLHPRRSSASCMMSMKDSALGSTGILLLEIELGSVEESDLLPRTWALGYRVCCNFKAPVLGVRCLLWAFLLPSSCSAWGLPGSVRGRGGGHEVGGVLPGGAGRWRAFRGPRAPICSLTSCSLPGSKPGAKAAPAPARVLAGGAVALWCPLLGSGSTPPSAAPPGFAKNSAHARLPHLLLAIRRVK